VVVVTLAEMGCNSRAGLGCTITSRNKLCILLVIVSECQKTLLNKKKKNKVLFYFFGTQYSSQERKKKKNKVLCLVSIVLKSEEKEKKQAKVHSPLRSYALHVAAVRGDRGHRHVGRRGGVRHDRGCSALLAVSPPILSPDDVGIGGPAGSATPQGSANLMLLLLASK